MQRNYPRMFSQADDQDKDGLKLENVGPLPHPFPTAISQSRSN